MHNINGLIYLPEYISEQHHDWLLLAIISELFLPPQENRGYA